MQDPPASEGDLDPLLTHPLRIKPREIESMKKALGLVLGKVAGGVCDTDIDVTNAGVVELLSSHDNFVPAVSDFSQPLLGSAAARRAEEKKEHQRASPSSRHLSVQRFAVQR